MTVNKNSNYLHALQVIHDKNAEKEGLKEAFETIDEEANSGNSEAMYYAGYCYEYGKGTSKDYEQAVFYYQKSANAGFVTAMEKLGFIFAYGKIIEKNLKTAVQWYDKAAIHGNKNAMHRLGKYFYNGHGVEQDYKKAVGYFKKLAEMNSSINQYKLAVCYYNGQGVVQNFANAAYWFEKSANLGYDNAMVCLGYCYEKGNGVKQSYEAAAEWYNAASRKGIVEAIIRLGFFYKEGLGVNKDAKKAFDLFVRAHDYYHDGIIPKICIGNCYTRGDGVEQDLSKASEWYNECAGSSEMIIIEKHEVSCMSDTRNLKELLAGATVLEDIECQCSMGHRYYYGFGITHDYRKAYEWYRKAAEKGNAEGQTFIWLTKFEETEGFDSLLKASDNNHEAKSLLADFYFGGWGGVKDVGKAVALYKEAADNGVAKAMYDLGWCYEHGVGIRKSYLKAEEWYSRFVKEWNEESINLLRNRVMMYR